MLPLPVPFLPPVRYRIVPYDRHAQLYEITIVLTLAAAALDTCVLTLAAVPSAVVLARRKSWLGV